MKMFGGVEVQLHAFLTSKLDGGEYSASHPGSRFTARERALAHPLNRRLGGLQSWSACGGKKIPAPARDQILVIA
jgi:hypothetical protein